MSSYFSLIPELSLIIPSLTQGKFAPCICILGCLISIFVRTFWSVLILGKTVPLPIVADTKIILFSSL